MMDLEMVLDGREHPSEASVKVSSRSNIRNHVKTPIVLLRTWTFPDRPGDGFRWEGQSIRSVCGSFINLWQSKDGVLRKQKSGGAIGSSLTGSLAVLLLVIQAVETWNL